LSLAWASFITSILGGIIPTPIWTARDIAHTIITMPPIMTLGITGTIIGMGIMSMTYTAVNPR